MIGGTANNSLSSFLTFAIVRLSRCVVSDELIGIEVQC